MTATGRLIRWSEDQKINATAQKLTETSATLHLPTGTFTCKFLYVYVIVSCQNRFDTTDVYVLLNIYTTTATLTKNFGLPKYRRSPQVSCKLPQISQDSSGTEDQQRRVKIVARAFQFAIPIDSIRYANRFESIRLVKKSAFRFTSCHAAFLVYLLYSLSQKISWRHCLRRLIL